MRLLAAAVAAAVAAVAAPGCVKAADRPGDRVRVVAGLYPLAYVARAVGGDRVDVVDLTPAGAEPHDLELAPSQVSAVERADLVLLVRGLQPEAEAAAPDRREVVLEAGNDPHVWLDPTALRTFAALVAARLEMADPDHDYTPAAVAFRERLDRLDADLRAGLAHCARRDLVTSHAAFAFLARRYGLRQIGISGFDPDAEPPPGKVAEIARYVRERGVTTVFSERLVSPKVAEAIARETGARTALLDPIESVSGDDDYETVMRRNLATLRPALGCT
ncbi:MAG TPA: zinc ABC transporter substrate-binding protein [Mycobacteriales bacterium]|jgi:zinc transport system substrate-binding protein